MWLTDLTTSNLRVRLHSNTRVCSGQPTADHHPVAASICVPAPHPPSFSLIDLSFFFIESASDSYSVSARLDVFSFDRTFTLHQTKSILLAVHATFRNPSRVLLHLHVTTCYLPSHLSLYLRCSDMRQTHFVLLCHASNTYGKHYSP
eukprot:m.366114 g.366114  ORF g.366114 m.366114 type:complete len:147 (-) comp34673_c0_seq1:442-882(-)